MAELRYPAEKNTNFNDVDLPYFRTFQNFVVGFGVSAYILEVVTCGNVSLVSPLMGEWHQFLSDKLKNVPTLRSKSTTF